MAVASADELADTATLMLWIKRYFDRRNNQRKNRLNQERLRRDLFIFVPRFIKGQSNAPG